MQIAHEKLAKGQKVWYRYSRFESMNGPFTVSSFGGDHQGRYVVLKAMGKEHTVHLADDDDFGLLLFYDEQPELKGT